MKKNFFFGAFCTLVLTMVVAASNIPQSWTWDKTSQWFTYPASSTAQIIASGDVELASKPTWADAN